MYLTSGKPLYQTGNRYLTMSLCRRGGQQHDVENLHPEQQEVDENILSHTLRPIYVQRPRLRGTMAESLEYMGYILV
jgi:hypothetical protein